MPRTLYAAFAIATFAWSASATVAANPSIQEVQGAASAGTTVVVRGAGFGARGPEIVLFEDFEGAAPGAAVGEGTSYIGRWSGTTGNPKIVSGGRSGGGAMRAYSDGTPDQATLVMPQKHREIFVSFWVRVPPGTRFPGDTRGPGQFSSDSSWKLSWLMDTDRGFGVHERYDICLPTYTGAASGFQLAGNTFHASDRYVGTGWWSWDHWMRVSTWIRNPQDKEPGGVFETLSEDRGYGRRRFGAPTDRLARSGQVFDVFSVPGWIRNGGGNNVRPEYDDVYVAVGPAAAARVELVNSRRYEDATKAELLLVSSWSGDRVEAEVPRGAGLDGETWYVFVTDGNGNRNSEGFALCTDCPLPPVLVLE